MAYEKSITTKKGVDGGIEGSIIAFVTIVVVGFLKRYVMTMDPGTENLVSALIGAIVAGALLALTRAVRNWLKHKNDGQQTEPDPEPEPAYDNTQPNQ